MAKKVKVENGQSHGPTVVNSAGPSSTRLPTVPSRPVHSSSRPPLGKDKPPSKAAVTDMSFFGAQPPAAAAKPLLKPKLPDIKKRDTPIPAPTPSASSAGSLLSATMNQLLKKADSPAPSFGTIQVPYIDTVPDRKIKLNRKGHTVNFKDLIPDGGPLESIRFFTQAPHELDAAPSQDDVHGMSTHELDMDEGKALKAHEGIEEVIDWYEPNSKPDLSPQSMTDPFDSIF